MGLETFQTTEQAAAEAAPVHVLVVDDETEVRELVRDYLVRHGFAVTAAESGAAMRAVLAVRPVHVVILDLKMPGEDGLSLARYLRQSGAIGIIMLTASAETVDRIVGLELGADDYMAKPFDPRELLARVRSLVRRLAPADGATPQARHGHEVRFGRFTLNLEAQRLYSLAGEEVPLTAMEFDLLKAFAERPNRVLSRDQLLTLAHNRDAEAFDRSIDIRIMRLRKKIEDNPDKPRVIRTVRGAGYLFDPSAAGTA
ncbi:response regulator [Chthonobacter rhizosphaerae]|uniref:response regulator n=1 Tax=Chthonobacter rhizosphaerae TaxID=2735553 RepID=UPI0015EF29AD|nr:response regulator [Chthonobacter rhizosphaerae]